MLNHDLMKGNRVLRCLAAIIMVVQGTSIHAFQAAKPFSRKDTALINVWYEHALDSMEGNLKKSDNLINKAWKMAIDMAYERGIADGYYYTGCVYEKKGQLDVASRYFERAISLYVEGQFLDNLPDCYMRVGKIRMGEDKHYTALQAFLEGLRVAEYKGNVLAQIELNIQVANYHNTISKDYPEAIAMLGAADELAKSQSHTTAFGQLYKQYGIGYAGLRNFDDALSYCQRAVQEFSRSVDQENLLGTLLIEAAIYAKMQNQTQLAEVLDEARPLLDTLASNPLHTQYTLLYATNLYLRKDYDDALVTCERLYRQVDRNAQFDEWRAVRSLHFRIWYALGNYQRADSLFNDYEFIRDSLYAAQYSGQRVEISENYKLERFERQIREQELRLTNTSYQRYGLIAGIVVLLTILGILYVHFREKDRLAHRVALKNAEISVQNEVLKQANRQNELLLREIHHRVKNNLQIISSLLNLQSRGTKSKEVMSMMRESSSRINSIALIHNKLYQQQSFSLLNIQDYIEQLAIHLLSIYNVDKKQIRFNVAAYDVSLDIDTAIPVGLILTELITNSLKYAFEGRDQGEIHIQIKREGDKAYTLLFKDNGIGIPEEKLNHTKDTLGFRLINSLTNQLAGTVQYTFSDFSTYTIQFKAQG